MWEATMPPSPQKSEENKFLMYSSSPGLIKTCKRTESTTTNETKEMQQFAYVGAKNMKWATKAKVI